MFATLEPVGGSMRIGVSILSAAGQSIWSNGIGQNAHFLAKLAQSLPFVEQTYILDCGDQTGAPTDALSTVAGIPIVKPGEVSDLDVAIEVSGAFDIEWIRRFRARGGKLVHHICGQPYAALIGPSIFNKPAYWAEPGRADEIWILPKDAPFKSMLQGIYRCPVHMTPYIWSSCFLEQTVDILRRDGAQFGYRRGDCGAGARIAILEPNISPIKTFSLSALICDLVERQNPNAISNVYLLNAEHLEGQTTFDFFLKNLELGKAGKLHLLGRDYIARVMSERANMVVSHQLECAQNYLYFDALHGGYPLVHNSPFFSGVGYYYHGNDVEEGARQLLHAWTRHDIALDDYRRCAEKASSEADPANARNMDVYARRLLALTAKKAQ
jgi:hypothetical protein